MGDACLIRREEEGGWGFSRRERDEGSCCEFVCGLCWYVMTIGAMGAMYVIRESV
jgi:hypothetical protein